MSELLQAPTNNEAYLMSRRSVVEAMLPPELMAVRKGILERLNREQSDLDMVNDVLNGYGYTEAIIESTAGVYDAQDGTTGAVEHPEDNQFIIRSID